RMERAAVIAALLLQQRSGLGANQLVFHQPVEHFGQREPLVLDTGLYNFLHTVSCIGIKTIPGKLEWGMETPLIRDAIRQIQDLVAEATGQMLQDDAERRLSDVLQALHSDAQSTSLGGRNFSDRDVTILIADLRGFAAITSTYPAS